MNVTPTINIDSRTDKADVERMVMQGMTAAIAKAKGEVYYEMSRGMA